MFQSKLFNYQRVQGCNYNYIYIYPTCIDYFFLVNLGNEWKWFTIFRRKTTSSLVHKCSKNVAALAMHRRLSHGLNQILQLCTPLNPMGKEPLPEVLRFPGKISHPNYGWLVVDLPYPSEKMMEFVSWDDDIPNFVGKIRNVPNHQSDGNTMGFWV